jgi:hypothetical protein
MRVATEELQLQDLPDIDARFEESQRSEAGHSEMDMHRPALEVQARPARQDTTVPLAPASGGVYKMPIDD